MRISHLSDLHFGRHDEALAEGMAAEVASQSPDLVVISGDFTQVGSREEFEAARTFLDSLTAPWFAVPGNHDIPERNLWRRFFDPYGLYRRYIYDDLEPYLEIDGVALAGIKTPRRMRMELNWAHGTISEEQLEELAEQFAETPPHKVRIVVAHHPMLMPEGPFMQPLRRVDRADLALATFARLGVRLVLSGHFHLSYVRKHEHPGEVKEGTPEGPREAAVGNILVAQASSTISTRLRGEPNAYNLIDIKQGEIDIDVREWNGTRWVTAEREVAPAAAEPVTATMPAG
jgi:3',5'-cyclic AMP phosphodiesterase CpdA